MRTANRLVIRCAACAALALLVSSCAHIRYDNTTRTPVSFTHNLGDGIEYKTVRHISNDYRRIWLLWYLVPIGKDGSDMVAASTGGADGLANLRITAQYDVIDVLVTNLTFGLFCTRKVRIQGDLVDILPAPDGDSTPITQPAGREPDDAVRLSAAYSGACPACKAPAQPGATFCTACGAKLPAPKVNVFCPACGTKAPDAASFCTHCGGKLGVPTASLVETAAKEE